MTGWGLFRFPGTKALRNASLIFVLYICAGTAVSLAASSHPSSSPQQADVKHSSSSIAITTDGEMLLVVNPDSNTISGIDLATGTLSFEIPVGLNPRSVSISPDDTTAYIANHESDNLSVIDLPSRMVIATLPVGDGPAGVAISPDGHVLAISETRADQIRLLDTRDLSATTIIPVIDRPYGLAFTPDSHRLLVTHLLSGYVTLIQAQPFNTYLPYITGAFEAQFRNGVSHSAPGRPLEDRILRTKHLFQDRPSTFNFQPSIAISTWPNVAPAASVLVSSTGARAYLPQTMANGLGYNTQFDTTVFPKVSVLNLEMNVHQTSEHISLPETDRPVGLPWDAALAKGDTELWVVNSASNDVSVINILNPTHPSRLANIPVGDHPLGIVIAPDEDHAYVYNTLAGSVSVIDTDSYTVTQEIQVTHIPLPPALLNGKRLFFSSQRPELAQARWISCNTCHVEGEQDGRTWFLQYLGSVPPGEQPVIRRNTTSLLGMIETYPLRWSAEWDESADSEFSVRFEQFGTGLIDGEMHPTLGEPNQGRSYNLDCLALFIDSLAAPQPTQLLSEAALRGKDIFESTQTQCSTCHPAPLYTDLRVHDVGTADGPGEWFGPLIDTPTLRFLYDSKPYLHDGSAPKLQDVLTTKNTGDQHGVTSHLTGQQLQDLESFLSALPFVENP